MPTAGFNSDQDLIDVPNLNLSFTELEEMRKRKKITKDEG
jgi:hypothetical protein